MAGKNNKDIIVRVGANTAEFNKAMKGLNSSFGALQKQMSAFGGMMAGALSVGAITAFAGASIQAADEQTKSNNKLLAALGGREDVQKRLLVQAEQIRSKTGLDDSAIIEIQAFSAAQGRSEDQIKKNTAAAVQLAAATGIDLLGAMKQVDATMEGNVGRLGKLDSRFKELTVTQLQNGEAVDLLLEKYTGLAESQATDLELLKSNWGEFQEQVGNALGVVMNPLLKEANELLRGLANPDISWMDKVAAFAPGGGGMVELKMKQAVTDKKAKDIEAIQNSPAFKAAVAEKVAANRAITGYDPNKKNNSNSKPPPKAKIGNSELSDEQKQATDHYNSMLVLQKIWREKSLEVDKTFNANVTELGKSAMQINVDGFRQTGEELQAYLDSYLAAQTEYHQAITDQYTLEAERYQEMLDKKLISEEQYNILVAKLKQDKINQDLAATADGLNGISSLFKEQTVAYKALATTQALISTYLAGVNILANTAKLGPIAMAIAFAGTIATGLATVAKINGVKLAEGGIVPDGYPNDTYPAMLTSGETVVPAKRLPDFQAQSVQVYGVIRAGDIYLSNKRGEYLTGRRG